MLSQYLDYQRETMLSKTEGLTRQQLAQQHPPSRARHWLGCSITCRWWKRTGWRCASLACPIASHGPAWTGMRIRTGSSVLRLSLSRSSCKARYHQACERSRHVVSNAAGLDQLSARVLRDGRHFSLRWVLLHLIEETARHAGHADFLREAIDGTVGE